MSAIIVRVPEDKRKEDVSGELTIPDYVCLLVNLEFASVHTWHTRLPLLDVSKIASVWKGDMWTLTNRRLLLFKLSRGYLGEIQECLHVDDSSTVVVTRNSKLERPRETTVSRTTRDTKDSVLRVRYVSDDVKDERRREFIRDSEYSSEVEAKNQLCVAVCGAAVSVAGILYQRLDPSFRKTMYQWLHVVHSIDDVRAMVSAWKQFWSRVKAARITHGSACLSLMVYQEPDAAPEHTMTTMDSKYTIRFLHMSPSVVSSTRTVVDDKEHINKELRVLHTKWVSRRDDVQRERMLCTQLQEFILS